MLHTLLVTGGAGFIGSNFVRDAVLRRGIRVVTLDRLTYAGSLENLADLAQNSGHLFVRGDVRDRPLVQRLLGEHRPAAVVHFAAESHVDRSIDAPGDFVSTNVVGTFELLEAIRAHISTLTPDTARAFRLLHVSTDWLEGAIEGHVSTNTAVSGKVRVEQGARVVIGDGCTILGSCVERSVLLEGSRIENVCRLESSLVGRRVTVSQKSTGGAALSLLVGDDSRVELGQEG
jgi:NAD(P)-dependent dehydrogenase (short-subunit alcohol dehydrogenase family)